MKRNPLGMAGMSAGFHGAVTSHDINASKKGLGPARACSARSQRDVGKTAFSSSHDVETTV